MNCARWSRSSVSALAQVVLMLAAWAEIMGLIHHVQCANYTVGVGFTDMNTSPWTNTVNELVRPAVLEAAYQQWADSVNVTVGDTLGQLLLYLLKPFMWKSCVGFKV